MSRCVIYPNKAFAESCQAKNIQSGVFPDSSMWLQQAHQDKSLTVDAFQHTNEQGVKLALTQDETVNNSSDTLFEVIIPSFYDYWSALQSMGTQSNNFAQCKADWLAYSNAAKALYFCYPRQCLVIFGYQQDKNYQPLNVMNRAAVSLDKEVSALEQELHAMNKDKPKQAAPPVLENIFPALLAVDSRLNQLTGQLSEQQALVSQSELAQLQISQLQEELESTCVLLQQERTIHHATEQNLSDKTSKIEAVSSDHELAKAQISQLQQQIEQLIQSHNQDKQIYEQAKYKHNESSHLSAELELSQLQISQLQEELEHYFKLYSESKRNSVDNMETSKQQIGDEMNTISAPTLKLIQRLFVTSPSE